MKLRRIITGFLLALVIALTIPVSTRADSGVILKVHYEREDKDYAPWDVWLWPAGGDGAGYAFEPEDGEMVATMEVPAGVISVGFIVRTQDWTKDIDMDQFIDITEVVSGTVHAYIKSGIEGYTKFYGDDVVIGTKLKSAVCSDEGDGILLTFTGELNEAQQASIEVSGTEGPVEIAEISYLGDDKYMLKLLKKLDLKRNYRLKYDGEAFKVNMPSIYSTPKFEEEYTYTGDDLGANYTKEKTVFKLWAPTADEAAVNLYESGNQWKQDLIESKSMTKSVNGTWELAVDSDIAGTYYTFTVVVDGARQEACDPYARTTGVNGKRAMVIDLDATDPEGWDKDVNPHTGENITDAIIYELHVRDFSIDESSGMVNKGKYLAFTEKGTVNSLGQRTGVDYLKDLGITHLHILPFYDYGSVDELSLDTPQFNWGYDPVNYNVPEGSYSTDPSDGAVRVKEAKQMVKALHDNGISVVMDVVYNHVYSAKDFCFNRLVPGYFSRINENGSYSNGSGCGNDTASERSMVRKYIVDSVNYWADEYHIDGFRFDLVGLLDVDTVNEIVESVHAKHPDVIFYGEGWVMNTDVTKEGLYMATQRSSARTPGFAYFNDGIRDALKGSVFNEETGFVSGAKGKAASLSSAFMAKEGWSNNPSQIVNYASCHDNMTLIDRISVSRKDASREELVRMNNLAAAFYMCSEGIPFMQAGEEMLRTKVKDDGSYDSNSYASTDLVNSIKWDKLGENEILANVDYYKGLISFRKTHHLLCLIDEASVKEHVTPVETGIDNVLAFEIKGDTDKEGIFLIFNATTESVEIPLPEGNWKAYIAGSKAGTKAIDGVITAGKATAGPISATVLSKGDQAGLKLFGGDNPIKKAGPLAVILPVAIGTVAGFISYFKRRRK
ncbi:MAG: type I pullulanase [Lachnospiraceae bacterium]|nr:type I pullulanase [Lachnospiraceae bacterium]